MRETELYPAIKTFLEGQGYAVKGEVGPADVMACRGDEPPLIVEMKTAFSLTLFHQGVARQALSDAVYLAVPLGRGRRWHSALREHVGLARRLGLGVLTVRLEDGLVQVHADPGPYRPRKSPKRTTALLREFARRTGDPSPGGTARADGLVTAYRQDALKLARHLAETGPGKGAAVAAATGVAQATRMMRDNHYGWFEKVSRGTYTLTETGRAALPGDAP